VDRQWPTAAEVGNALVIEAEGDAKRLGHKLVGWASRDGRYYSRCAECLETVIVAPRHMGVARIRGVAAVLPCAKGKKK
jgi:hypothetical protein